MDIYLLILLIIILIPLPLLSGEAYDKSYLSYDSTQYIRGILAVLVVYHHLSYMDNGILFPVLKYCGSCFCGFFFFLTGYGMMTKLKNNFYYYRTILRKRIPHLMIPFLICFVLYFGEYSVAGGEDSFLVALLKMFSDKSIVSNSWYVTVVLGFYLMYFLICLVCDKFFGRNRKILIFSIIICIFFYIIIAYIKQLGVWWYDSAIGLVIGIIWAENYKKITEWLQKHYFINVIIAGSMFIVALLGRIVYQKYFVSPVVDLGLTEICVMAFATSLIMLSMKIQLRSKLILIISEISYELYIIHGLWLNLLKSNLLYIQNNILYSLLVILCSLISAYLINKVAKNYYQNVL